MVSLNFKLLISFNSYIVSDFYIEHRALLPLMIMAKHFFNLGFPPRESFKYEISKDFW